MTSLSVPIRTPSSESCSTEFRTRSDTFSKRKFLNITRYNDEKYAASYEKSLLDSVRRRFQQCFQALDFPHKQLSSLIYTMLQGEPLRFFSTVQEAFNMPQKHYLSSGHRDLHINEWNFHSLIWRSRSVSFVFNTVR